MSLSATDHLTFVARQVVQLQKSVVELTERSQTDKRSHDSSVDSLLLDIIDIVDLVDGLILITEDPYLQKIGKRLLNLLKRRGVFRCDFPDGVAIVGQVKVLETRNAVGEPEGKILEICRHGYLFGERVIRAAEVITCRNQK